MQRKEIDKVNLTRGNTFRLPIRKVKGGFFCSLTDSKRYTSTSSWRLPYNGVPIDSFGCAVQRYTYRQSEMCRSCHFATTFKNCFSFQQKNSNDSFTSDLTNCKKKCYGPLDFNSIVLGSLLTASTEFGTIGTFRLTSTIPFLDKSENVEENPDAMTAC